MEKQTITYDNLPKAISQVLTLLEGIENRLNAMHPCHQSQQSAELLNVQQAAELMGVAVQTVYGYVTRREIPNIKRKKRLLFERDVLIAWMREGNRPTAEAMLADAKATADALICNAYKPIKKS